ncbi:MAG: radical SAM family heme chaperone HemW [Alphaproteobacteria bacterium]|nr:radical SAM family heme chaperone HemW [Alphaproteobacteria bacterium]
MTKTLPVIKTLPVPKTLPVTKHSISDESALDESIPDESVSDESVPDESVCVYIHWPFCTHICPYCDFNVYGARPIDPMIWLAAYQKEIAHAAKLRAQSPLREPMQRPSKESVKSIFFGGGTPSLMPPQLIASLIDSIDKQWGLASTAEISLEANPNDISPAKLKELRGAGITRLSFGVQSLNDKILQFLGRTHTAAQAVKAFTEAQNVFDVTSHDLIYACPDQSLADWQEDLKQALALQPAHLSAYQLTIEKRTHFYRLYQKGKLMPLDEAQQVAFYQTTYEMCQQAGLRQYEIANYARPQKHCRHNYAIWQGADYIGLGPGAHGRITYWDAKNKQISRYATLGERKPSAWLAAVEAKGHGLAECEILDRAALRDEILLMGLRLNKGLARARLAALDMQIDESQWHNLVEEGFLHNDPTRLIATPKGRLVLDSVIAALV